MKVLVATDGSETAAAAVRSAATLAFRCRKSSLTVITVGNFPTRLWQRRARSGRLETSIEEREGVSSEKGLETGRPCRRRRDPVPTAPLPQPCGEVPDRDHREAAFAASDGQRGGKAHGGAGCFGSVRRDQHLHGTSLGCGRPPG